MSQNRKSKHHSAPEQIGDRVRIVQRGNIWQAQYMLDGKQIRQTLDTRNKKLARTRAVELEVQLASGQAKHQQPPPSLEQVVNAYMAYLRTEARSPKTLAKYQHVFHEVLILADNTRTQSIEQLDLRFIDLYRQDLAEAKRAPKTIHNKTVIVRQLVNFALRRYRLEVDPLRHLKISKPKPRPQPCWTVAEVEKILAAASAHYRPALVLLAETGMRVGELKHLTWDDIDLDRGVILIRPKDGWRPKTGDPRHVPMLPNARDVLMALPRHARWVVTSRGAGERSNSRDQISERRLLEHLKRILKRLGLQGHLHTFRHSFISRALLAGVAEAVVRDWVGHVDRDVLRLYTHVRLADSQAALLTMIETPGRDEEEAQPSRASDDVVRRPPRRPK